MFRKPVGSSLVRPQRTHQRRALACCAARAAARCRSARVAERVPCGRRRPGGGDPFGTGVPGSWGHGCHGKAEADGRVERKALADQRAANVVPIIRDVQRAGLESLRAIAEALNARGVRTARGGMWHASSVRDALKRVEARR
jgi:hypothetical protein